MGRLLFILSCIIALASCRAGGEEGDSMPDKDIKVFRYDRLQYEAAAMNSVSALQKMNLDCPQATRLLIEDVLSLGKVDEPGINERLCAYYSDSTLLMLMEDASEKYKDMSELERKFTEGFRRLRKDIPRLTVPRVYSQVSALNQSVVVGDSLLGFSIDKYMGADYPLYQKYYYDYQRRSMDSDRILPDCFTFYLLSLYPFQWSPGHRSLFDVIMYRGKISWVARRALGMDSDADMLGYTAEEAAWCRKYGTTLWHWMEEQHHLGSTDPMVIRAYTHADPSMVFRGERIPPFIGIWVGMQLTEKYMKQHPQVGVEQLLELTDFGPLALE